MKKLVKGFASVILASMIFVVSCKHPVKPEDKTPPAEATNVTATAGVGKVSLSWTNPSDSDLYQVEITAKSEDGGICPRALYQTAAQGKADSANINELSADKTYVFTIKTIDKAGNKSGGKSTEPVVVKGLSPMNLTLTQDPAKETWTKDNVRITVASSTSIKEAKWMSGEKTAQAVMESGTAIDGTSFEVSENGSYSVAVQDNDGRREVETIKIGNIDKTAPTVPGNFSAEYQYGAKKIVLKWTPADDTGSGIKEYVITYKIDGTSKDSQSVAADKKSFELPNITPTDPIQTYEFQLKAVDMVGNESELASAMAKPSEQAVVTGISVSRKKVEINDPDRTITITVNGSQLTKAAKLKITGIGTGYTCTPADDAVVTTEFTLPKEEKNYTVRVALQTSSTAPLTIISGIEAKTAVCKTDIPYGSQNIAIRKQDDSQFECDTYNVLMIQQGIGGKMKVVLTGTHFDIDGMQAGIRFNDQDIVGVPNEDGTILTIENIDIPTTAGTYHIEPQYKAAYMGGYEHYGRKDYRNNFYPYSRPFRVKGAIKLQWLLFDGYKPENAGQNSKLLIKGENFDTLTADDLAGIRSDLACTISNPKVIDSFTIVTDYTIPVLADDNPTGKKETIRLAGESISVPLHTFEIDMDQPPYLIKSYYSIPADGTVIVPYGVTGIGDNVFTDCTEVKRIQFPATVTSITHSSTSNIFKGCKNLTEVDLSATKITEIPGNDYRDGPFVGCDALETVLFPATLEKLGVKAFYGCSKLKTVDMSTAKITALRAEEDYDQKIYGIFTDCTSLETVKLPPTLEKIDRATFSGCKNLKTIDLSGTRLIEIDGTRDDNYNSYGAFTNCTALDTVRFPATLATLGDYAFNDCSTLKAADLSGTKVSKIGDRAFSGCTALDTVRFPATLETIGTTAFCKCSTLKKADLSGTKVREIGTEAFDGCTALDTVRFPATLETLGENAFYGCSKLGSVTFADVYKWAVYNDENYTDKKADIPDTDLQDAATAATLLTNTYRDKYWKKN